ncbi:MAG: RHS repeat-associated core domain-containing protein, partial [Ktedonobacteraceae bacterium]
VLNLHDRTPGAGVPAQPDRLDRTFHYDPLYRLLAANGRECQLLLPEPWNAAPRCQNPDGTLLYSEAYAYDPTDNLARLEHVAEGNTFTRTLELLQGTNRLASLHVGNTAYAYHYDANGNMTHETEARIFTWDHRNCLMNVTGEILENQQAAFSSVYSYDSAGQRVKQVLRSQDGLASAIITIDGLFEVQRMGSGAEKVENSLHHILDLNRRIALVRVGPALPDDPAPATQYLLADHLYSSNVVIGQDGAWLNREEYTPFGETSFGSFVHKRFRYSSKERDDGSGFYYYGARYLSPWLGRWISPDPSGTTDGLNLYAFVKSNPLTLIDNDGHVSHVATTPRRSTRRRAVVNISIRGILVDDTAAGNITLAQRRALIRQLSAQFARSYSRTDHTNNVEYRGTLTLRAAGPIQQSDHVYRIVDPGNIPGTNGNVGVLGRAPFYQNVIYISSITIPRIPATAGVYANTGKTTTGLGTLERTGTHEAGHSLGLRHPTIGTRNRNLMHQTGQPNAGMRLRSRQLRRIARHYNQGRMNQGAQH